MVINTVGAKFFGFILRKQIDKLVVLLGDNFVGFNWGCVQSIKFNCFSFKVSFRVKPACTEL